MITKHVSEGNKVMKKVGYWVLLEGIMGEKTKLESLGLIHPFSLQVSLL